jgi:branched-chain amino acid transport system substrate-binding protein
MLRRFGSRAAAMGAAITMIAVGFAASPAGASAPGVTSNSITLGLISSLSGPSASENDGVVAAVNARLDVQNAQGGVNGRKLKLVVKDDATNPATNEAASGSLLSSALGVMDLTPVAFGGYKVLEQAGVPVTGGAYDGPEWWEQPNTNMFSISGPADPKDPQYTNYASFSKSHGATRCGSVGYGISPSSQAAASGFVFACQKAGLTNAYLNNTLPFGSVNVTTLALQLKAANVNALYLPLDANTNFAILTALKQAGINMKVVINATGYGQPLIDDTSAVPDAQGAWFAPTGTPVELKTTATKAFQAALAKYAHFTGVPDFSYYEGWGAADLMIQGLKGAGKNPTQSSVISALQKLKAYDTGGLEPPVNLTLSHFGKAAKTLCGYLAQFKGSTFANPTKVCGTMIPNSNQQPSA